VEVRENYGFRLSVVRFMTGIAVRHGGDGGDGGGDGDDGDDDDDDSAFVTPGSNKIPYER